MDKCHATNYVSEPHERMTVTIEYIVMPATLHSYTQVS
jgi:hypothetical protein